MTSLLKPIITEKSMRDASRGVYTFLVARHATKTQLQKLVQDLFSVQVTKLTTSLRPLPARRTGRRRLLRSSAPQKLVRVWLAPGQSIDLFDLKED